MRSVKRSILRTLFVTAALLLLLTGFCACGGQQEYSISTPAVTEGGKVTLSARSVKPGEEVTVTLTPHTGYELAALRVNDADVTAEVTEGTYRFVPTGESAVAAEFRAIPYRITYMDGDTPMTDLSPATYTVAQTVELPHPEKQGYAFVGWYAHNTLSGIESTRISAGTTGDKVFYAKWEFGKVRVEGSLKSAVKQIGGTEQALYTLDYSLAEVIFRDEAGTETTVAVDERGAYAAALVPGVYTVMFVHPNFECGTGNSVVVTSEGVTPETVENTVLTITTPRLTGDFREELPEWVLADQSAFWDVENGVAKAIDPRGVDVFFAGQVSNRYIMEVRICSLVPRNTSTDRDKKAGVMVAAYGTGSRDWLILDQDNTLVRIWNSGTWNTTEKRSADSLNLKGEEGTLLTVVRMEEAVFVFIDDVYFGQMNLPTSERAGFGFAILGSTAEFRDYWYSYNDAIIRDKLASSLILPSDTEYATVTADRTDGIAMGDEISFTVTPKTGSSVISFTVNGTEYVQELVAAGDSYILRYRVTDTTVSIGILTLVADTGSGGYGEFIPFT